ncbi:MAG TPA: D-2-hydroxyacid dehydrogenase [Candidatus Sphingobacterium stercoripullorum]|nr:D-2-hydroxyacid dehydrogenase [Candidatus Sphingobacterium stercoripullorum]
MEISIVDGFTLNPGDLNWDEIAELGELKIYDRTKPDEIIERCQNSEIILTNKVPIDAEAINNLPNLKYIGVTATGYNIIDIEAAKERGIVVTNVPGYSTESVVQLTFALLTELCHRVQKHSDAVSSGKWSSSLDFSFWDYPLIELSGKTMGVIGFGGIGQRVADVAEAFGMKVIAHSRTETDQSKRKNFEWVDLDGLFSRADVISIHSPLTTKTEGLVNKDRLKTMKPSAFIINTARGPIIVEEDLAWALNNGVIAGAGLDVLSQEPPKGDNPLLQAKNCIITPHIAWASVEARKRLMGMIVENIKAYLAGSPIHVVNS